MMNNEVLKLIKSKNIREIFQKTNWDLSLADQAALVLKYVKNKNKSKKLVDEIRSNTSDVNVLSEIDNMDEFRAENRYLNFPNFFRDGDLVKYTKKGIIHYAVVIGDQETYDESIAYVVDIERFMKHTIETKEDFGAVINRFHDHVPFELISVLDMKKDLILLPHISKNYTCFVYCYRMYKNWK